MPHNQSLQLTIGSAGTSVGAYVVGASTGDAPLVKSNSFVFGVSDETHSLPTKMTKEDFHKKAISVIKPQKMYG